MGAIATFHVASMWPQLIAWHNVLLLPLAAGLPPILAIMESVYVMTGREIWKQAARFWSRVFGIALLSWALGAIVLTALYVADHARVTRHLHGTAGSALIVFLAPVAFAAGVLLWYAFVNWAAPGRVRHLVLTWLWVPLSGFVVLKLSVAFGLLDDPAGVDLDPGTLKVWITDVPAVLLNPAAQSRFVHLLGACYLAAATLVLSVSAWYLLRSRNVQIAHRSLAVAASFGLAAALSLGVLGDQRGYAHSPGQKMRIAAIAAEWHTRTQPAPFTVFGIPDVHARTTRMAVDVPWLLGLGATHSWRKSVPGLAELEAVNAARIRDGIGAFTVLDTTRANPAGAVFDLGDTPNLGYGLLLLRHTRSPARADAALIAAAAADTIPNVPLLFWGFRGMALLGSYAIALFGCAFWLVATRRADRPWFLRLALWSLPVPWIAGALGWIISEVGRGPWLVDGLLPLTMVDAGHAGSPIAAAGWIAVAILAVVGVALITALVRLGPDGLNLWPADSSRKRAW